MSEIRELRIPHMGSVENARIVAWCIAEGERYAQGDILYEVETDKTHTEVEADSDGLLLRRLAAEDDELKVGDLVGLSGDSEVSDAQLDAAVARLNRQSGAEAPEASPGAGEPPAVGTQDTSPAAPGAGRHSPLVRRLAKEHGIDPDQVRGTGPGGRVTGDDVRAAADGPAATGDAGGLAGIPAGYETLPRTEVKNSLRRQTIARRLSGAAQDIPLLTADMEIQIEHLLVVRNQLSAKRVQAGSTAISTFSCIAAAVCRQLKAHPELNAAFTQETRYLWDRINLGVAVDTPEGLVVPVVKDADTLGVEELNDAIRALTARTLEGELSQEDLECGTFTLSNPGALGPVLRAEAILNPPQVALLGLPAIRQVPVAVIGDSGDCDVAVRTVLCPSLTFDHRALDGGHAIRFLNGLLESLEDPDWLLD